MTGNEHLQICNLILTVRTPLYIGSGNSVKKTDYIFDPNRKIVWMVDPSAFFSMLMRRDLIDHYENAVLSGHFDLLTFLRGCGLHEDEYADFCTYSVQVSGALDGEHSLKEIHTFVRNAANQAYIPGSSVKGALRTILLSEMIRTEKRGNWPTGAEKSRRNADEMYTLEAEYFHTLGLDKKKKGNMVNSVMRGLSVSDSPLIPDSCMTLSGKTDLLPNGETREINLRRECIKPGTKIELRLTLDRSILPNNLDKQYLVRAIERYDRYYEQTFLSHFDYRYQTNTEYIDRYLILGGGSGFFSKTLPYQYFGEERGLETVAPIMRQLFPKHGHDKDIPLHEISPHTLKYGELNGVLLPYGICEVELQ